MKHLTIITTFLLINFSYSQVLINTPFNLNPGGYITDVTYFAPSNSYIIIGDFSSINGIPRHNIAFLNSDFSFVQSFNPILSSDNYFQTIAVKGNRIFIGGEFTSLTPNYSLYNGMLSSTNSIFEMEYNSDLEFVGRNWNIIGDFAPYAPGGINDLEIHGDSLLIAGKFSSSALPIFYNLACFNLTTNSFDGGFASSTQGAIDHVFDIEKHQEKIYLSGNQTINGNPLSRTNEQGNEDLSFIPPTIPANSPSPFYYYNSIHNESETIISAIKNNASWKFGFYDLIGNQIFTPLLPSLSGEIRDLNTYKYNIYRAQSNHNQIYQYTYYNNQLNQNWSATHNNTAFNNIDHPNRRLIIENNYLFVSSSSLTNSDGQPRTGLAIFCLEPNYMTDFNIFESDVCSGQNIRYKIDSVEFAYGYHWSFTGSGAKINGIDISTGGADFIGEDKNDVTIEYTSQFTPGILVVKAFSKCGVQTTDSTFIHINQLPPPVIQTLADTNLNCHVDSLQLIQTRPINTTSGWYDFQSIFHPSDSIIVSTPGNYVYELTDFTNCKNYDTVFIQIDTIKPNHNASTYYDELNCRDTSMVLETYSTTLNTSSFWRIGSTTIFDSIQIVSPGTYTSLSINNSNGCMDSSYTLISQNFSPPQFNIFGFMSIPSFGFLDTLNCETNTLQLIAIEDSNHLSYWTDSMSTNLGQTLQVSSAGTYFLFSSDSTSGCKSIKEIHIAIDTALPSFQPLQNLSINCSLDSVLLDANVYGFSTNYYWKSSNNTLISDSSFVNEPGFYTFVIKDELNKCLDSSQIEIIKSNEILFNNQPIWTCHNNEIDVSGTPIYFSEPLIYSWSNGNYDSTQTVLIISDSTFNLSVFNIDSSCYGNTNIEVFISPTPKDSVLIANPCAESGLGSAYIYVTDGFPISEYSLDGINWQTTPYFDSISIGIHDATIKDSIGCIHHLTFELEEGDNLDSIKFLVSTHNLQFDTIHIDFVSFPMPDTILWDFDGTPNIFSATISHPIIQYLDTGTFSIQSTTFINGCEQNLTKEIIVHPFDHEVAQINNSNKIANALLYPNPTQSIIQIELLFYKKQDGKILLTDQFGNNYFEEYFFETLEVQKSYNLNDLGISNGIYFIKIISEFDFKIIPFSYSK